MKPDKQALLAQLQRGGPEGPTPEATRSRELMVRAPAREDVRQWFAALEPLLPPEDDPQLAEFLRLAVMGVCVGFIDRHLSPEVEAHRAIVPLLLDDIQSVYAQLKALGATIDRDQFRWRAFDYGIHKAYYLDWTLYLSREPY